MYCLITTWHLIIVGWWELKSKQSAHSSYLFSMASPACHGFSRSDRTEARDDDLGKCEAEASQDHRPVMSKWLLWSWTPRWKVQIRLPRRGQFWGRSLSWRAESLLGHRRAFTIKPLPAFHPPCHSPLTVNPSVCLASSVSPCHKEQLFSLFDPMGRMSRLAWNDHIVWTRKRLGCLSPAGECLLFRHNIAHPESDTPLHHSQSLLQRRHSQDWTVNKYIGLSLDFPFLLWNVLRPREITSRLLRDCEDLSLCGMSKKTQRWAEKLEFCGVVITY